MIRIDSYQLDVIKQSRREAEDFFKQKRIRGWPTVLFLDNGIFLKLPEKGKK